MLFPRWPRGRVPGLESLVFWSDGILVDTSAMNDRACMAREGAWGSRRGKVGGFGGKPSQPWGEPWRYHMKHSVDSGSLLFACCSPLMSRCPASCHRVWKYVSFWKPLLGWYKSWLRPLSVFYPDHSPQPAAVCSSLFCLPLNSEWFPVLHLPSVLYFILTVQQQ